MGSATKALAPDQRRRHRGGLACLEIGLGYMKAVHIVAPFMPPEGRAAMAPYAASCRESLHELRGIVGLDPSEDRSPDPLADTLTARREALESLADADWLAEWDGDFRRLEDPDVCEQAFGGRIEMAYAAEAEVEKYEARLWEAGNMEAGLGRPAS
jgi:hypothetical protein